MINNYKAKKSVRAEAVGAIYKGRPASVYIKENEQAINGTSHFGLSTHEASGWTVSSGWTISGDTFVASNTSGLMYKVGTSLLEAGKTYLAKINVTNYSGSGFPKVYAGGAQASFASGNGTKTTIVTANNTQTKFGLNASSFTGTIDRVEFYEITDFSYKLMAVTDALPAIHMSTSGLMDELLPEASQTAFGNAWDDSADAIVFNLGSGTDMTTGTTANTFVASGATYAVHSSYASGYGKLINTGSAQGYVSLGFDSVAGHKYILSVKVVAGDNSNVDISLSSSTSWNTGAQNLDNNTGTGVVTPEYTANDTSSFLLIRNTSAVSGEFSYTDDIKVYGVYGYDAFINPKYRSGLVTNIWDASTGRLKDPAAAGDTVEVQYQGECTTSATGSDTEYVDRVITRINSTGIVQGEVVADANLPNSIGVVSDPDKALSNENDIILWQGVESPEFFSYNNSVTVKVKCSEAITKFRPVSLYIDSVGDLLCKHDDIPNAAIPADRDYLSATPGKWGMPELGGATGETIPVTVAGKTKINTGTGNLSAGQLIRQLKEDGTVDNASATNNNYAPNVLGTIMEDNPAGSTADIAITIFSGVPDGAVTDWKRIIKITATALGSITQYCPVSLFLDEFGNYKCVGDDIPNNATDDENAIWVDKRRWGIAQEAVSSGAKVEIIVQGRTKVVDTLDSANRTEFVTKIDSAGVVTSSSNTAMALTSLGVVETEAKASTSVNGTIIIY